MDNDLLNILRDLKALEFSLSTHLNDANTLIVETCATPASDSAMRSFFGARDALTLCAKIIQDADLAHARRDANNTMKLIEAGEMPVMH